MSKELVCYDIDNTLIEWGFFVDEVFTKYKLDLRNENKIVGIISDRPKFLIKLVLWYISLFTNLSPDFYYSSFHRRGKEFALGKYKDIYSNCGFYTYIGNSSLDQLSADLASWDYIDEEDIREW